VLNLAYGPGVIGYFRDLITNCNPPSPLCTMSTYGGVNGTYEASRDKGSGHDALWHVMWSLQHMPQGLLARLVFLQGPVGLLLSVD
jgi:hypothetical protein